MSRALFAVLGVIAILVLGACTSNTDEADAPSAGTSAHHHDHGEDGSQQGGGAVPEGVAQQYAKLEQAISENGGETTSGQWRVAYVVGPAKAWQVQEGDGYTTREPAPGETNHIEIIPFEASTGRVVPDVPIRLELLDASGEVVQAQDLNFYWSDFVHYANNFSVPAQGRYTLRAALGAPAFLRHEHGGQGGPPALAEGTTVEFTDVEIDPGG